MEIYVVVTIIILLITVIILWKRVDSLERIVKVLCTYITLRDEDVIKEIRKDLLNKKWGIMGKEKQEHETKELIDELSKMPPMVIATAFLHAINYKLYGEDVTEKWITATQNARALEKAYRKGYYDALQKQSDSKTAEPPKLKTIYKKLKRAVDDI